MSDDAVYRDVEHAIAVAFSEVIPDLKSMFSEVGGGGLTRADLIVQNAMVKSIAMRECDFLEIKVFQLKFGSAFEVHQAVNALVLALKPNRLSFAVATQVTHTWASTGFGRKRHKPLAQWARDLRIPYGTLTSQTSVYRASLTNHWNNGLRTMQDALNEKKLLRRADTI